MSQDNIIIIGAGASGIIMGCQLQRQLNFTNFEIYEKGKDFGGTWLDNTYPGCGCDVPSHFYSFSFEKKHDWTQLFALQPEIQEYILNVCKKYNLYEHARFQTECLGAEWNKETERWTVNFKNLKTGETFSKSCKFLVAAAGILSLPNPLTVPGAEKFKGKLWHTSQWDHNVNLEDKNVIVIGNGCSATQFIPVILPKVKTLSQFVRSPHWIRYKPNWTYTDNFKMAMKYIPGALSIYRLRWAYLLETFFKMAKASETVYRKNLTEGAEQYIKSLAPEKYHKLLIPKSQVGFKRSVFDTGYLKCLDDSKLLLTDDPLVQIKEKSVLTKSGKEYPADVIVCANGFQVHERLMPMSIKGKSGEDMRSRWKRQGGARAYMGVMVADYPNMFIMVGPNTASGHYSMIFMSECNADYAIRLMKPLIGTSGKGSIEVTEEAEKRYVDWIQEKLKDFIWTRGSGWFVDNKNGYNGVTYPHYQTHYWLNTLRPKWSDFKVSGERKKALSFDIIFAILFIIGLVLLKAMMN